MSVATLESVLGELKFDEPDMDTSLAKEYLTKYNSEFGPLSYLQSEKIKTVTQQELLDDGGNKILCVDDEGFCKINEILSFINSYEKGNKLEKLAKKVEENSELFSQLEFLIRKTPVEEIRTCDIKLIVQNMVHYNSRTYTEHECSCTYSKYIPISSKTPLAVLGCLAQMIVEDYSEWYYIISEPNTAVISYLFTQLCHEVGLPVVMVPVVNLEMLQIYPQWQFVGRRGSGGGLGVLTERCDLDSALHAFATSSSREPWRLRKVLIQESIYESFRSTIAVLTTVKSLPLDGSDHTIKYTEAFIIEDKTFLLDFTGTTTELEDSSSQIILVEAYRTTKELLSLINEFDASCLSVWCEGISQAHEISFGTNVPAVWVNDIGTFEGPPAVSQSFYCTFIHKYLKDAIKAELKEISSVRKSWLKMDIDKRRVQLHKCIENFVSSASDKDGECLKLANNVLGKLTDWKSDSIVAVYDDKMCVVIPESTGELILGSFSSLNMTVEAVISIINGNCLLTVQGNEYNKFFDVLVEERLPVVYREKRNFFSWTQLNYKVVWTNYGTVFAN